MSDTYPNRVAFLTAIATLEGTVTSPATKCDGYDVIVTGVDGKPEVFTDFSDHPFASKNGLPGRPAKQINSKGLYSTASGRYQLLLRWWLGYRSILGLRDFSPVNQDAVALQQIRERAALILIDNGDIALAVQACSSGPNRGALWASLPGATYTNQTARSMDAFMDAYTKAGGKVK